VRTPDLLPNAAPCAQRSAKAPRTRGTPLATALLGLALAGCSSAPPPADWQMNAKSSLERATSAWLSGNSRLEALEFARARADLARTGRPELVARAELLRCATRVASLVFEPCPGFDALAQDASAEDRAYARYLAGTATPADLPLLPPQHRAVAAGGPLDPAALAEPLSPLVAAGASMRRAQVTPQLVRQAVDSASAQGWSRPLLAWLQVALRGAEASGDEPGAAALRRRIALLAQPPGGAASAP
jgi:hypothetical protein